MMHVAAVHTSDRGNFKSCRRRWGWSSHLTRGLEPYYRASPLLFGSAIHFALEDFHGLHQYPRPEEAFLDFMEACRGLEPRRMPVDYPELLELGVGMLRHYEYWLESRPVFPTLIVDGVPQTEVTFEIELPIDPSLLEEAGLDKVVARGTIDRISVDPITGFLWPIDYKTAANFEVFVNKEQTNNHLLTDPQVTNYTWAAGLIYDRPIGGFIYQQHRKLAPKEPRLLSTGKISNDPKQLTTHKMYRDALIQLYGSIKAAPQLNKDCLDELAATEAEFADRYVQQDYAYRNPQQLEAEGVKLLLEAEEMIDPRTPLYPHHGRHCSYCPFLSPCLSMDDGGDWESELSDPNLFLPRNQETSTWKTVVKHYKGPVLPRVKMLPPLEILRHQRQLRHHSLNSHPIHPSLSPQQLPDEAQPQDQESLQLHSDNPYLQ